MLQRIYNTNFENGPKGNSIRQGDDLVIQVKEAKNVSGALYKRNNLFFWKLIQVEQTGSRQNPEKDKITFELKKIDKQTKNIVPMEPGKYLVKIRGYFNHTILGWDDEFEIIEGDSSF